MTRKDYKLIAEAIKNSAIDEGSKRNIVGNLAMKLCIDNDRFDVDKFEVACGVK